MGQDLRDKMLAAGIIPENAVKQMEQWQMLPTGSADKIRKFDPAKVKALKDEVELSGLPRVRETIADAHKLVEKAAAGNRRWAFRNPSLAVEGVLAGEDRLGRLIIPIPMGDMIAYNQLSMLMRPMTLATVGTNDEGLRIANVEILYTDKIPTHWFVELEPIGGEEDTPE